MHDIICAVVEWCGKNNMLCDIRVIPTSSIDYGVGGYMVILKLMHRGKCIANSFYVAGGFLSRENYEIGNLNALQMERFLEEAKKGLEIKEAENEKGKE